MGTQTDAARAEVLASRAALLSEVQRLEASARAAVDIPGKARRNPGRTAGLAAGTAFFALGGPRRLYRRARRAVFGPDANLPKSMLPDEVEKTLRVLGTDGDRVRGTVEREFARYLGDRAKFIREQDAVGLATSLAGNVLRPVSVRLGRQLAERLFDPDAEGFEQAVAKVRARYASRDAATAAAPAKGSARDAATATPGP